MVLNGPQFGPKVCYRSDDFIEGNSTCCWRALSHLFVPLGHTVEACLSIETQVLILNFNSAFSCLLQLTFTLGNIISLRPRQS